MDVPLSLFVSVSLHVPPLSLPTSLCLVCVLGMGVEAAKTHPPSLRLFQEASDVLGIDLLSLCENGPIETLNRTDMAQPALLTASMAAYRKWQDTHKEVSIHPKP